MKFLNKVWKRKRRKLLESFNTMQGILNSDPSGFTSQLRAATESSTSILIVATNLSSKMWGFID